MHTVSISKVSRSFRYRSGFLLSSQLRIWLNCPLQPVLQLIYKELTIVTTSWPLSDSRKNRNQKSKWKKNLEWDNRFVAQQWFSFWTVECPVTWEKSDSRRCQLRDPHSVLSKHLVGPLNQMGDWHNNRGRNFHSWPANIKSLTI